MILSEIHNLKQLSDRFIEDGIDMFRTVNPIHALSPENPWYDLGFTYWVMDKPKVPLMPPIITEGTDEIRFHGPRPEATKPHACTDLGSQDLSIFRQSIRQMMTLVEY